MSSPVTTVHSERESSTQTKQIQRTKQQRIGELKKPLSEREERRFVEILIHDKNQSLIRQQKKKN